MAPEIISNINDQLGGNEIEVLGDNIIGVTRFNWEYEKALEFQYWCCEFVRANPKLSIIIFTNHPTCLTIGRGLQRNAKDKMELVDFNPEIKKHLTIPVYEVKRGGGVTFHHPGQLVVYPIINLTEKKISVYSLINRLFKITTECLYELYGLTEFDYCRNLLGLWKENTKYASIGLQVRRYVTLHGMALNLNKDSLFEKNLNLIYPCGLPPKSYGNIEDLTSKKTGAEETQSLMKSKLPILLA